MSKFVLLNARIFAGGTDLTSASNQVELGCEVEDKDVTTFADGGWKASIGGLASTTISASGFWEAGDGKVDGEMWTAVNGREPIPWTVCPDTAAVGELAYLTHGLTTSYAIGDAVGEAMPWEGEAAGSNLLVRGTVLHPPGAARTADGDGDEVQVGALSASQKLVAVLHVLSVAGSTPSLTVEVESSADNTFTSPTTQASFSAASGAGSQVVTVDGPVTDTYWRVTWDITGSNPSFLFVVAVGVA